MAYVLSLSCHTHSLRLQCFCHAWCKHPLILWKSLKQIMVAYCHPRITTLATILQRKGHPDCQPRYLDRRSRSRSLNATFRLLNIQNQHFILNVTFMILTPLSRVLWLKLSATASLVRTFIYNACKSLTYNPLHFAQANVLGKSCKWWYWILRSFDNLSKSFNPCITPRTVLSRGPWARFHRNYRFVQRDQRSQRRFFSRTWGGSSRTFRSHCEV